MFVPTTQFVLLVVFQIFCHQLVVEAQAADGRITEWKEYYKLEAIEKFVDYLANKHDFINLEMLPEKTFEGREMRVVKVCKGGCGTKKAVWIDGGIHPR